MAGVVEEEGSVEEEASALVEEGTRGESSLDRTFAGRVRFLNIPGERKRKGEGGKEGKGRRGRG